MWEPHELAAPAFECLSSHCVPRKSALLCLPALDHPRLEFSGLIHDDGLVASPGKCNALGTLYPIALCGLSSL